MSRSPTRLGALFVLALAACAGSSRAVRKPDATLTITCPVDDARVYVDEIFVGRAVELREHTLHVVSGVHRVEVRADGFFTAYRDVPASSGAPGRLEVPLRRVPDGEPGG